MYRLKCFWILVFIHCFMLCESGSEEKVQTAANATNLFLNSSVESDTDSFSVSAETLNNGLEPSVNVEDSLQEHTHARSLTQEIVAEATSLNSGAANQITNSDAQVFVTLTDSASEELHNRATTIEETITEHTNNTQPISSDIDRKDNNNLTEEIPSFSEWTQQQIEAEKVKETSTNASMTASNTGNGQKKMVRWKNYASLDCGAKVVASNQEAVSPSAVLSPSRDEYKLNTCTSRIWFVVELCEAIQAKKIDLANFELFSSSPKDFSVFVSDRFPTRDWSNVGQFAAKDERDVQSFDLHPHLFGKYIKVEVKSHYGSEHYCPISLFRVYGTSEFEVLKEDQGNNEDDDDENDENLDVENGKNPTNLFTSATDAVISIVKKAASVLGPKNQANRTDVQTSMENVTLVKSCRSPRHLVICHNCTDALYGQVFELLSCFHALVENLVVTPIIRHVINDTNLCRHFGFEFNNKTMHPSIIGEYVRALFKQDWLGAMCNHFAVLANRLAINVTVPYSNLTQSKSDEIVGLESSESNAIVSSELDSTTESLILTAPDAITRTTSVTDTSITSQISPTRTVTSDLNLDLNQSSLTDQAASTEEKTNGTELEKAGDDGREVLQVELKDAEEQVLMENATETIENIDLERLINDLSGEGQVVSKINTVAPQGQKESVFLRLSNRIKALERNMSLSGQYLEELSKRYKKQVEEMQKMLEKTILAMGEESKRTHERNRNLEERLDALTSNLEVLLAEKKGWSSTIFCIVVSSLTTFFILTFCQGKSTPEVDLPPKAKPEVTRRRSLGDKDGVDAQKPKKQRRPSDQAMKIVARCANEENPGKKKRKKRTSINRSASIGAAPDEDADDGYGTFKPQTMSSQVWARAEPIRADWADEGERLVEVPLVLEESEHSILEPLDERDVKITPPKYARTAQHAREFRVADRNSPRVIDQNDADVNGDDPQEEQQAKREKRGFRRIFRKVF